MTVNTFRTWVKVDGFYPAEGMAHGSRSKDRLILKIGRIVGWRGVEVPAHGVSIEMGPILPQFQEMSRLLEFGGLADSVEIRCNQTLARDGVVIATCQLDAGHDGDHVEAGCAQEHDNWPPLACLRWPRGEATFRPYDPDAPGTWRWQDDEEPPTLEMPYTGRLAEGVRQMRRRWHHRVVTHEVPLPEMESFLSHRRDVDPLTLFLYWVGNQLGGVQEGQVLNSSRVFLRQPDHDRLLAMERFWAERLTGDPNAAWAQELNLAPMAIEAMGEAPAWTRHGVVYVIAGAMQAPGHKGSA